MTKTPDIELPTASGVAAPNDHSPEALRAWIMAVCAYLQITPTEFAKVGGLAASTLNRFLRQPGATTLSARTIDALVDAARKMERSLPPVVDPPKVAGDDLLDVEQAHLTDVPVLGPTAHGYFQGALEWSRRNSVMRLPVRAPYHRMGIGAFEVQDDHADPIFPKGSIVVATAFPKDNSHLPQLEPKDGDYVLVFTQNRQPDGPNVGKLELTIRKIVVSPTNDLWLMRINRDMEEVPDLFIGPYERWTRAMPRPFALIHQSLNFYPTIFPSSAN